MAKKNKKQQSGHPPQNKPLGTVQPQINELKAKSEELQIENAKLEALQIENAKLESEFPEHILQPEEGDSSAEKLLDSESPAINSGSLSPAVSTTELSKLITTAVKLTEEAKRNNDRAKNWSVRANAMEESWNNKTKEVAKNESDLKTRKEALLAEEKEYQTKKEELIKLQADAEAGFIARRTELLTGLEEEIRKYSARYLEHDRKIQEELEASEKALEEKRNKINEEKQLAEDGLRESRRNIESELRKAQWLRQDLEDEKKAWKERIEQEVTRGIAEFQDELNRLRQTNADQHAKIQSMDESLKSVGNRSASDLANEIENQKKTIDSLNNLLAKAPGVEEQNRAKKLQSDNDRLIQELERIQQENQALHIRAGKASIGVAELESLRDQREAWKTRELGYRARLDELKSDIEEYTAKVNDRAIFPACSDMDRDEFLQKPPIIRKVKELDLKVFTSDVRNLIGTTDLFYRPEDIRSFIGGLAACRLHILQGISGTGKTSLPLAFSKVMQWGSDLSEVQSGWRDRNDLLGYFNTFEKKFYESSILKALYKANCPGYENLPFFIILDEMNLSHPEHYFADFLSALEQRKDDKSVALLTSPLAEGDGPVCLIDRGQRLRVPPNVWFIGTANQDETTKDFADKTYDRAHIMEFPRHREQFNPERPNIPAGIISFEQMQHAFDQAIQQHSTSGEEAIRILDGKLRSPLEDLDIGWGNRLETQIRRYVPVLVACGGSVSEGLDTILAHKLLRKVKGRFDISADELSKLKSRIASVWSEHPGLKSARPDRSNDLITAELRRLGNKS
jgi:hypothetical protein